MSQQAVSADTIANLADGIFLKNQKEQRQKQQGILIRWLPQKFRGLKI
jgi:hypothetical protein